MQRILSASNPFIRKRYFECCGIRQATSRLQCHFNLGCGLRFSHCSPTSASKVTIPDIYRMAREKEPIAVITAHDSFSAKLADRSGVDILLVGDSLAMVAMGFESTNQITLEDMIYHSRAVARGAKRPFLVTDLPFGSYEQGPDQALASTIEMIKRGNAQCVKFEGGRELVPIVEKLAQFGLASMPHIGLTPQRHVQTGGFKVQGKTAESAYTLLEDALALESAGATMLLLEGVPSLVAKEICQQVKIPVIGIGAGPMTHGQVLVQLDMLGGFDEFTPRFVKKYADILNYATDAISSYRNDVKQGSFPAAEHCYTINKDELAQFKAMAEKRKHD